MVTVVLAYLLLGLAARAGADERFYGDTSCGKPTCHGSAVPKALPQSGCRAAPQAWKWAWSQWRNTRVDHHSRAYHTLETEQSKAIAGYMNVTATESDKCLRCHAPDATAMPGSNYQRKDGVSCEHCHGGSELWKEAHSQKDWKQRKAEFVAKGFYDNADFRKRAEKCAQCHVEIDHEIIAGGHPPLQFEMVSYAQLMKHWNDSEGQPAGADCVEPTLWSIGQLVGLRHTAEMIARRAGNEDYQSLGKFAHFKERNCYACHHKLVDDALRQAHGHYAMADVIAATLAPEQRGALTAAWSQLVGATGSDAEAAQRHAQELAKVAAELEQRVTASPVGSDAAKALLKQITASGAAFKSTRHFTHALPETSNVERLSEVSLPWWYTTGAPEQTVLAVQALCTAAFDAKGDSGKCTPGPQGIYAELRQLLESTDRSKYDADKFTRALAAIHAKLF